MGIDPITAENLKALHILQSATRGWIAHAEWSPDGRLLACSSAGGVAIWRGTLESAPVFIKQHDGPVKGVTFAPNSATLATASADTTVKVWDLRAFSPSMQPMNVYTDHTSAAEKVLFERHGGVIACGVDGTVRIWRGTSKLTLEGHTDEVNSITLSADGRLLASGGRDKSICIWNTLTGELLQRFEAHQDWVRVLRFHPSAPRLLSASRDHSAAVWDIQDPAQPQRLFTLAHMGDVRAATWDAHGELIATGSTDAQIQLWRADDGTPLHSFSGHTNPVLTLCFHPQNLFLVSGGGDNLLHLWGVLS